MLTGFAATPSSWGVFSWALASSPDWRQVLDEVASAGYTGMELGRHGWLPPDRGLLQAEFASRGLRAVAGFVAVSLADPAAKDAALSTADEVAGLVSAAGGRHLVVLDRIGQEPRNRTAGRSEAAERLGPRDWRQLVEMVTRIGEVARDHDLSVAFHPHAGTHVEFSDEIERLMAETEPELVGICLDTGHCLYAGIDPTAMLRQAAGRVTYLHVKDLDAGVLASAIEHRLSFQEAVAQGVFCPLGSGDVDLPAFRAAVDAVGYEGWLTVERDRFAPGDLTAMAEAAASLELLLDLGFTYEKAVRA